MKKVTIVSGCYNEAGNIEELCERIQKVFAALPQYSYEQILIDNFSSDGTRDILRGLAKKNKRIKVILNNRNFGVNRSGAYALLQAKGDAVIAMVSDLQDPPELIPQFLAKWEEGFNMVVARRANNVQSSFIIRTCRNLYYFLMGKFSEGGVVQIPNFTGFGLYDQSVISALRSMPDPNPYVRGMLSEIGSKWAEVEFIQPPRTRGKSSNNFFSLLDYALLGFVNYSKAPIRLATIAGLFLSGLSLLIALVYLVRKLLYWDSFQLGLAPLIIGMFFFSAVQLFFIGMIGEYVGGVFVHVKNHPLVFVEEKLNFDVKDEV